MNNITNWMLAIIIVLLLGGGVYWIYTNQNPKYSNNTTNASTDNNEANTDTKELPKLTTEINDADHKLGPDSATVKLVEYADFQCPACKQLSPLFKSMVDKFPGKVQFVYRHFPLSYHPLAKDGARISEAAAAQGKYYEMNDFLFANDYTLDSAYEHAATLGLDVEKMKSEVSAGKYDAKIDADFNSGQASGVAGTPTLYMNGTQLSWEDTTGLENAIIKALGQ